MQQSQGGSLILKQHLTRLQNRQSVPVGSADVEELAEAFEREFLSAVDGDGGVERRQGPADEAVDEHEVVLPAVGGGDGDRSEDGTESAVGRDGCLAHLVASARKLKRRKLIENGKEE